MTAADLNFSCFRNGIQANWSDFGSKLKGLDQREKCYIICVLAVGKEKFSQALVTVTVEKKTYTVKLSSFARLCTV